MIPHIDVPYILKKANLKSMQELAKETEVHYNTVYAWNDKRGTPKLKQLIKICKLLKTRNINDFVRYN